MRVDLDAKVRTSDGEDVGSVQRIVVDPGTNEVTDVVISTGAILGRAVLVPRAELDRATEDGDALRLSLGKPDLESLPTYTPADYVVAPVDRVAGGGPAFVGGGFMWPASYGYLAGVPSEAVASHGEQVSIDKGAAVLDRGGIELGVVEDVRFEPRGGDLRGIVLRVGRPLRTLFGGGYTAEITRRQIDRVEDGRVYLRVAKADIERRVR